jgi:hypothetical protein
MKLQAKARLMASRSDPTDGGTQFALLNDGIPDSRPEVQELTLNDGTLDDPVEQPLLIDDLPIGP